MQKEGDPLTRRARAHAALGDVARLSIVDALLLGDASPGEIGQQLTMPTNLVAHHLNVLQQAGLVDRFRSTGDRRRTYVRLTGDVLRLLDPQPRPVPARVLFVCTENSGRSPLAAAIWQRCSAIPVASAGTRPATLVHPLAVRTAKRHGLALASDRPVDLADVADEGDLVIAVCDSAHEYLATRNASGLHWSVPDPARVGTAEAFESAYTELAQRIATVTARLDR
jgi:protein-tyrosine-phosphatase/DNA-binding transcriptional ArsR family regulator